MIAFVHESISLFFLPARDASVPSLVPRSVLAEANGLILGTSYGSLPLAAALFSGLRLAISRPPSEEQVRTLVSLYEQELARYRADADAARKLGTDYTASPHLFG